MFFFRSHGNWNFGVIYYFWVCGNCHFGVGCWGSDLYLGRKLLSGDLAQKDPRHMSSVFFIRTSHL